MARGCFSLCCLAALIVVGSGCAKARASTEPIMPVLTPPPPPPRVVEWYVDGPVPTVEPSPVETALMIPPTRTPVRPAARPEAAKPEPEPVRAGPEPERVVAGAPPLTLKPAPGVEGKTHASIRMLLDDTSRNLKLVNYAALSADGRAQYDIARGFKEQAEEAVKAGNLAFAGKLADKAATMAAVLVR